MLYKTMAEIRDNQVPEAIVRKLRGVIGRGRAVTLLRGAAATLAVATACLLAVMGVDYWVVIFSNAARWAMSLAALGATLLAGLWLIARPLARRRGLAAAARAVESRHPQFMERLSSAVELLTSTDAPVLRGSDELIAALAAQASCDAEALNPGREISFRGAAWPMAAAAAVLGVLAGLLVLWPNQAGMLLRRAMLENVSRVSATSLKITRADAADLKAWNRDGIDYVMLAGGRLHVELAVADQAVTEAQFRLAVSSRLALSLSNGSNRKSDFAGGAENVLSMAHLGDGPDGSRRFAITCPPAQGSLRFRLGAGDALTRYYSVRVVPAPAVRGIDVRIDYPAYTRRAAESATDVAGDIAAVAGSKATISVRAATPPAKAEFVVGGRNYPARTGAAPDGSSVYAYSFELIRGPKYRWSVRLTDEYGFTNPPAEHAIEVLPDCPPLAVLTAPPRSPRPAQARLKLKPTDRLSVAYRVADDFGIASAALEVEADGRKCPPIKLAAGPTTMPARTPVWGPQGSADAPPASIEGMTVLDLAAMDLQGARQVTVRVVAADWLPRELGGPGRGASEPRVIDIDAGAPSFAEQVVQAAQKHLGEILQAAMMELEKSREDSAPLRRIVPKSKDLTEAAVTRVDRLRGHLAAAETVLRDAIDANAAAAFEAFNEKINAIADEHVAKALQLAGLIKIFDDPNQRGSTADEADFQVDRSISLVNELLKDLAAAGAKATRDLGLNGLARVAAQAPGGAGPMMTDTSAAALAKLGIAPANWARLPGKLRDQLLQAARSDGPREYRELIRGYFQELARRGAAGEGAGGEGGKP
jgi:hypothetical protein